MIEIRKRITLKTAKCPKCQKKGTLKRILWGMPSAEIYIENYIIGGCCLPENPHEIGCIRCGWTGWRGSLIPSRRIHRAGN
jgi:Zn ribbon nucleic-acid-binding protein